MVIETMTNSRSLISRWRSSSLSSIELLVSLASWPFLPLDDVSVPVASNRDVGGRCSLQSTRKYRCITGEAGHSSVLSRAMHCTRIRMRIAALRRAVMHRRNLKCLAAMLHREGLVVRSGHEMERTKYEHDHAKDHLSPWPLVNPRSDASLSLVQAVISARC